MWSYPNYGFIMFKDSPPCYLATLSPATGSAGASGPAGAPASTDSASAAEMIRATATLQHRLCDLIICRTCLFVRIVSQVVCTGSW